MRRSPGFSDPEPLPPRFLTAEWRYLAMLNYQVDPSVLVPYLPAGTELDLWAGKSLVSLVGFLFLNTRVLGLAVPGHRNFEEVNLRCYVRRKARDGWRRGVVFVKEIVPRRAIAWVARLVYNENYVALRMRHQVTWQEGGAVSPGRAEYQWRYAGRWNRLGVVVAGSAALPKPGSEEEFVTEHYWGYSAGRDGGSLEYRVEHPTWRVWRAEEAELECAVEALYGREFAGSLGAKPSSAFLAEGSEVTVYRGVRLPTGLAAR